MRNAILRLHKFPDCAEHIYYCTSFPCYIEFYVDMAMDLDMNLDEFSAAPNGRDNLFKCSLCATTFSALSSWDSNKKVRSLIIKYTRLWMMTEGTLGVAPRCGAALNIGFYNALGKHFMKSYCFWPHFWYMSRFTIYVHWLILQRSALCTRPPSSLTEAAAAAEKKKKTIMRGRRERSSRSRSEIITVMKLIRTSMDLTNSMTWMPTNFAYRS